MYFFDTRIEFTLILSAEWFYSIGSNKLKASFIPVRMEGNKSAKCFETVSAVSLLELNLRQYADRKCPKASVRAYRWNAFHSSGGRI